MKNEISLVEAELEDDYPFENNDEVPFKQS